MTALLPQGVGDRAEKREGVTQLLPAVSERACGSQVDIIKLDFLLPAIALLPLTTELLERLACTNHLHFFITHSVLTSLSFDK